MGKKMKKLKDYTEQELNEMDSFKLWELSNQHERDYAFDQTEGDLCPDVETIFNILDGYLKFCLKFGRPYNEKDIFNSQSLYWKEYNLVIDKENKIKVQNFWRRDEGIDLR